jgi:flagellar biosynthetic protein FlhB
MAGNDKRFDATASRLARAKREGDLPRSHDVSVVASLGVAGALTFVLLWPLGAAARLALVQATHPGAYSPLPYIAIGGYALAIVVAALSAAVTASYVQAGGFTLKFPAPKFEKLNPGPGLGRMFGRDAAIGGAKALVIASSVLVAAWVPVRDTFGAARGGASPAALASLVVHALEGALAGALGVALAFAVLDVLVERNKWKRRLRMSFDEVRRDHKQNEGDPLVRGRRRQQHRALIRGSISRVREAAFVVTNPTHVAIALEYRPPDVAVPRVLVRAIDEGAREVKRLARELRVPVVENVPLARELLATTDVGDFIPPGAYGAVAAIVALLLREKAIAS